MGMLGWGMTDSKVVRNDSNECKEAESTDYEDEHSTKQ